jgi:hypothetical protein
LGLIDDVSGCGQDRGWAHHSGSSVLELGGLVLV